MERTYTLEPHEQQSVAVLEQERTQALAQVGALLLDLDTAKQALTMTQERHRAFLRNALASRQVQQFENARLVNGQIRVQLPDDPSAQQERWPPAQKPDVDERRANGAIHEAE